MTEPEHDALLANVKSPELRASLKHLGEMIEQSPWPEQPEPPPKPAAFVRRATLERYWVLGCHEAGDRREERPGGRDGVKKGANEVVKHFEALHREAMNANYKIWRMRLDGQP